jgi:hypothetical protein
MLSIRKQYLKQFVRGFYESEGNISRGAVYITNTNKELLQFMQRLLESLKFKTSLHMQIQSNPNWAPRYWLYLLGGVKESRRFLKVFKPCIKNYVGNIAPLGSDEFRRKISQAKKGRTIPWNKGRIYSPEIRRAISLGVKKKWQEPKYREKGLRHLKSLNQRREEFGCIRAG